MIEVVLHRNESIHITIAGTDGAFQVTYGKSKLTVKEMENLQDDKGRKGVLYEHNYSKNNAAVVAPAEQLEEPANPLQSDQATEDSPDATQNA